MGVQQARCTGSTPHSGYSNSSAVGQQARVGGDAEVVAACVYGLFPRKPFHLGEETRGHSRTTLSSLLYARTGRSSDLPRSCVSPSHAPVAVHSGCTLWGVLRLQDGALSAGLTAAGLFGICTRFPLGVADGGVCLRPVERTILSVFGVAKVATLSNTPKYIS